MADPFQGQLTPGWVYVHRYVICRYIDACMHACSQSFLRSFIHPFIDSFFPYMCTCLHTCLHTCMHAYIHTYMHTYTCMCLQKQGCVCIYTYIYMNLFSLYTVIHIHTYKCILNLSIYPSVYLSMYPPPSVSDIWSSTLSRLVERLGP